MRSMFPTALLTLLTLTAWNNDETATNCRPDQVMQDGVCVAATADEPSPEELAQAEADAQAAQEQAEAETTQAATNQADPNAAPATPPAATVIPTGDGVTGDDGALKCTKENGLTGMWLGDLTSPVSTRGHERFALRGISCGTKANRQEGLVVRNGQVVTVYHVWRSLPAIGTAPTWAAPTYAADDKAIGYVAAEKDLEKIEGLLVECDGYEAGYCRAKKPEEKKVAVKSATVKIVGDGTIDIKADGS